MVLTLLDGFKEFDLMYQQNLTYHSHSYNLMSFKTMSREEVVYSHIVFA